MPVWQSVLVVCLLAWAALAAGRPGGFGGGATATEVGWAGLRCKCQLRAHARVMAWHVHWPAPQGKPSAPLTTLPQLDDCTLLLGNALNATFDMCAAISGLGSDAFQLYWTVLPEEAGSESYRRVQWGMAGTTTGQSYLAVRPGGVGRQGGG